VVPVADREVTYLSFTNNLNSCPLADPVPETVFWNGYIGVVSVILLEAMGAQLFWLEPVIQINVGADKHPPLLVTNM
jgi:hypothetical protein